MPNNEALQVFYGSIPVIITVFVAVFTNNKRLDDLREGLSARITDLKTGIESRLSSIENRLTAIESRLSDVEKGQRAVR